MKFLMNNIKKIASLIIVVILAIVLGALFIVFSDRRKPEVLGESDTEIQKLEFEHTSTNERYDYNFKINSVSKTETEIKSAVYENGTQTIEATTIPADVEKSEPFHLIIPKLNVNSPIITGVDGEAAIHQGVWLYPNSYEDDGEKILLGHRRYWGVDDPRSFWNLDQLVSGDTIKYVNAQGLVTTYAVKSVAVRNEGDLSVLKPSKENMIKVISCSTADGSAGSSEKRIVVIAEQI